MSSNLGQSVKIGVKPVGTNQVALTPSALEHSVKCSLIDTEGVISKSEFYLTNTSTNEKIQLCLTPEKIDVKSAANFRTYNIVERGEIKLPKGERLSTISWEGIMPGAGILLYPHVTHAAWDKPDELIKELDKWRSDGDKITLLVTQTPINLDVYIRAFNWSASGGQGDYKYSIELVAAKDLQVLTVAEADARRAEQTDLKTRPRQQSPLGKHISRVDDIYSAVKILTGSGSFDDVMRVAGSQLLDKF